MCSHLRFSPNIRKCKTHPAADGPRRQDAFRFSTAFQVGFPQAIVSLLLRTSADYELIVNVTCTSPRPRASAQPDKSSIFPSLV